MAENEDPSPKVLPSTNLELLEKVAYGSKSRGEPKEMLAGYLGPDGRVGAFGSFSSASPNILIKNPSMPEDSGGLYIGGGLEAVCEPGAAGGACWP